MQWLQKFLLRINGLHYPQEYLCLDKETLETPMQVYLVNGNTIIQSLSSHHLFTGYSPLIITLTAPKMEGHSFPPMIRIVFTPLHLQPNGILGEKDAVAELSLTFFRKQEVEGFDIWHYEATNGRHRLISQFHQALIHFYNRTYQQKAGNVFLRDNLYTQVQIAYSLPRIISLITVSDGSCFNLFPTDLHGAIGETHYLISLRHQGKAAAQVLQTRRILLSNQDPVSFKWVYSLGKNHMQDMKPADQFPFSPLRSTNFHLPLPSSAVFYGELELLDSFDHGIHKLLLFKVVSTESINEAPATLAHVHNVYATWRYNKGLSGNYLMR